VTTSAYTPLRHLMLSAIADGCVRRSVAPGGTWHSTRIPPGTHSGFAYKAVDALIRDERGLVDAPPEEFGWLSPTDAGWDLLEQWNTLHPLEVTS
jgi:hypothetical protein